MELKIRKIKKTISKKYIDVAFIEEENLVQNRFLTEGVVFFSCVLKEKKYVIKHYSVNNTEKGKIEKIKKEYEILRYSSKHNGIVKVFGFDRVDCNNNTTGYNLVMDYLPITLQSYLVERGPLTRKEMYSFLEQMNSVLYFLHFNSDFQIVHMDIKPSNIGVKLENEVIKYILFDFDVSVINPEKEILTNENIKGLTPKYCAPELEVILLKGKKEKIGNKVDIYSVGIIAIEMVTGKKEFEYSKLLIEIGKMPKYDRRILLPLIQTKPENRPSKLLSNKQEASKFEASKFEAYGETQILLPLLLVLVSIVLIGLLYLIINK